MTTKEKQGFGLYFLLAFGLAWLCQVGGCMALLQKQNAVLYQLALIVTMLCPLAAGWRRKTFFTSSVAASGQNMLTASSV